MSIQGDKGSHPLVQAIEKRMVDFVNAAQESLNELDAETAEPCEFVGAEPVQVVRYTVGQGACVRSFFHLRRQQAQALRRLYISFRQQSAWKQLAQTRESRALTLFSGWQHRAHDDHEYLSGATEFRGPQCVPCWPRCGRTTLHSSDCRLLLTALRCGNISSLSASARR